MPESETPDLAEGSSLSMRRRLSSIVRMSELLMCDGVDIDGDVAALGGGAWLKARLLPAMLRRAEFSLKLNDGEFWKMEPSILSGGVLVGVTS